MSLPTKEIPRPEIAFTSLTIKFSIRGKGIGDWGSGIGDRGLGIGDRGLGIGDRGLGRIYI
ncbi:hypothetical protein BLD44_024575 [Mastigocladus laminosus UU774]|nr:hypothetical protein BLD44_024575 [Mastigocladus laminosus UU774]